MNMNNKEASFANHNLEEDLKKAQRELEKELVESKVGLIDQETSNHPQEIMVNGIKVSPEFTRELSRLGS